MRDIERLTIVYIMLSHTNEDSGLNDAFDVDEDNEYEGFEGVSRDVWNNLPQDKQDSMRLGKLTTKIWHMLDLQ